MTSEPSMKHHKSPLSTPCNYVVCSDGSCGPLFVIVSPLVVGGDSRHTPWYQVVRSDLLAAHVGQWMAHCVLHRLPVTRSIEPSVLSNAPALSFKVCLGAKQSTANKYCEDDTLAARFDYLLGCCLAHCPLGTRQSNLMIIALCFAVTSHDLP